MIDINTKQIELAARHFANKTQFMSNYPHDWQSSYDAYIQGATDALQPTMCGVSQQRELLINFYSKQCGGMNDTNKDDIIREVDNYIYQTSNNEVAVCPYCGSEGTIKNDRKHKLCTNCGKGLQI